jgi:GT2 family glycosyltransferase
VGVVVASHERAARLRILLDALAGQTLARERWELVVVHTYEPDVVADLLEQHELARSGLLRHAWIHPSDARPSRQRNIGWRMSRGRLVAFTDDDCRPPPEWLERLVAESRANSGAIVQGATRADPRERNLLSHPHVRTLHVDPPGRFTQTCNILYERAVLERIGGLDERAITGEDIDLAIRAQDAGARLVAAPEALVYHAVEALSLLEKIRSQHKWQHLAYIVRQHPRLREQCTMRIWWKPEHLGAAISLVALVGARRRRWMLVGLLPYVHIERRRYGKGKLVQLRAFREMPAHWVVEVAELATFIRGSVRYRTLLL